MDNLYDVVVVGGGAAGLTAALYLARARYRVVVVEKERFGGQITITGEVVNYPGLERTTGARLAETIRRQAESFGAEFLAAEVEGLAIRDDIKAVRTTRGDLRCFGLVLATGAHPRTIGFKGETEFQGRGVAYCATCDGEFFTGKDVFVVGGGFAAAEEAVFLTRYARHVTILVRGENFSCAASVADIARNHKDITVLCNTVVEEVSGDTELRSLTYRNNVTGEVTEFRPKEGETFGVFVFAGYVPATALVRDLVDLNAQGYIQVDRYQRTSVDGVYAAGDVCVKRLRQVVTAVADGAIAATELEKYVSERQEMTGLRPTPPTPAPAAAPAPAANDEDGNSDELFSPEMQAQLAGLFAKMARPLVLRLTLDDREVSRDLRRYMEELADLTDKLSVEIADGEEADPLPPCVRICHADGTGTGIAFHGVPGGHEFTTFALALYNAAGPGQTLDDDLKAAIAAIDHPVTIQILISLTCTVCPDTVKAAQRLAAENPLISAEAYDLDHFAELRERYKVMSVPCVVIDGDTTVFGRQSIKDLVARIQ